MYSFCSHFVKRRYPVEIKGKTEFVRILFSCFESRIALQDQANRLIWGRDSACPWAQTPENMAVVFDALFDKTGDRPWLDEALPAVDEVLEVFREAQASYYLENAESLRADILARIG